MKTMTRPSGHRAIARAITTFAAAAASAGGAHAATLRVPADRATIQAAIVAAQSGDSVLVSPGTYLERINFLGKALTVISVEGPSKTIIDAQGLGTVARIPLDPGSVARLSGFTLQHGLSEWDSLAGGIYATGGGKVRIDHNVVVDNTSASTGGICVYLVSATVEDNLIARNQGGTAGGLTVLASGHFVVNHNTIELNMGTGGGGMDIETDSNPAIERNIVRNNSAQVGGGVLVSVVRDPLFANNLVYGNVATSFAAGLYINGAVGRSGGRWVNNTIADNTSPTGEQVVFEGPVAALKFANNAVSGSGVGPAVFCDDSYGPATPVLTANDIYASGSVAAGGSCAVAAVSGTNLSVAPGFVSSTRHDYRLAGGSGLIDAGANGPARDLPKDLAGSPRIADGGHGEIVDIGAYEFVPR